MPEIFKFEPPRLPSDEASDESIKKETDLPFIHRGSQSAAFEHPDSSEKIVTKVINPERPHTEKEHAILYYSHRILSILFPEDFPRLHALSKRQ